MNRVRDLIRELHRRSLWQVCGIYLFGSWIALQVVDVIAENFALPAWTFPFAVVILLLGFPVVLATAFVQEGVAPRANRAPAGRRHGRHGTEHSAAARPAPTAQRIFTWRNALLGGGAAFALWGIVAAAYLGTTRVTGGTPASTEATLAVLPFENLGDPADAYFADGMAHDVRSRLATVPRLRVIAHGSVERYRDSAESPEVIAQQLGATHLLTARVRWDRSATGPSRVRVTPELVEVGLDGRATVKWQTTVDAVLQDVFSVEAEIATKVSEGLNVVFRGRDRDRLAARSTDNLEAYDAYLRGTLIQRRAGGEVTETRRAVGFFEQAVALDPAFADAWAELSRALVGIWVAIPTREVQDRAAAAARRAVEIAPERHAPHAAMASYLYGIELDAVGAAEAAERGLRIAPRDPDLLLIAAACDISLGLPDRGIARLDLVRTLDPLNGLLARRRAYTLLSLRRHDEALAEATRALDLLPDHLDAAQSVAVAHLSQGDSAAARAFMREAATRFSPARLVAYFGVYWDLYWILDDEQQRLLLTLPPASMDDDRGTWAILRAQLYAHRGETTIARAWGDTAVREFTKQIRESPNTPELSVYLGLAQAYAGRAAEAIEAAEAGVMLALREGHASPSMTYYEHLLVRIYIMAGRHEQAIDLLESLLEKPYYLSPALLRIDPNFDPLRAHPRFRRLVGTAAPDQEVTP